jgi:hypothetical protein
MESKQGEDDRVSREFIRVSTDCPEWLKSQGVCLRQIQANADRTRIVGNRGTLRIIVEVRRHEGSLTLSTCRFFIPVGTLRMALADALDAELRIKSFLG